MPMDFGGTNDCIVRWKTNQIQGSDLFICSHGGWNGARTDIEDCQFYFYGSHDKPITAGECYTIMKSDQRNKACSICGGGSLWDYVLTEFPGDWDTAIESVTEARSEHNLRYDCCMVSDARRNGEEIRVSHVLAAFSGYDRYHLMACRVEMANVKIRRFFGASV